MRPFIELAWDVAYEDIMFQLDHTLLNEWVESERFGEDDVGYCAQVEVFDTLLAEHCRLLCLGYTDSVAGEWSRFIDWISELIPESTDVCVSLEIDAYLPEFARRLLDYQARGMLQRPARHRSQICTEESLLLAELATFASARDLEWQYLSAEEQRRWWTFVEKFNRAGNAY